VKLRLSHAARRERYEAVRFYQARSPAAAKRFTNELRRTFTQLERYPMSGSVVFGDIRHAQLHDFPFSIVYGLTQDVVDVIAIAHDSRDPNYWRDRIS
jgi:plasmid stabilization system protein ParE